MLFEPMRSPDVTRFLLRIACFAPLVGVVLLVNWVCALPPVRRLFTGTLDAAAEALVAGKTIRSQIDMADLKPIWIEHLQTSRMLQIRQDWVQPHAANPSGLVPTAHSLESGHAVGRFCRRGRDFSAMPGDRETSGIGAVGIESHPHVRREVACCASAGAPFSSRAAALRNLSADLLLRSAHAGHLALGSASICAPASLGGLRHAGASRVPVTSRWKR